MSSPLAQVISEVKHRAQSTQWTSLFLDFDGTLTPIVADPAESQLDFAAAEALQTIANQQSTSAAIVSGRSVEDLYRRIHLEKLIYAGNHGLEIFGHDLAFVEPLAWASRTRLEQICRELEAELQAFEGALVEYKGLTASIHYRQAAKADAAAIRAVVVAAVAQADALFRVHPGRKVWNILPRSNWHKGAAVQWINSHLTEQQVLSIYLGDDVTDEDAFRALPDAITIKVGYAGSTAARFQLPDPASVHEFLQWLAAEGPSVVGRTIRLPIRA